MNELPDNMRFGGGLSSLHDAPRGACPDGDCHHSDVCAPAEICSGSLSADCSFCTFRTADIRRRRPHVCRTHPDYVGWMRVFAKDRSSQNEIDSHGLSPIDKVFVLWAICRAVATYLEFFQVQAALNQCGFLLDAIGGFLLLRFFIRDEEDAARVVKTFATVASFLAVTMLFEKLHGLNLFGYIGGRLTPFIRDGAIRSQGPFLGPIPAGTVGGTLLLVCMVMEKQEISFVWCCRNGRRLGYGIYISIEHAVDGIACRNSCDGILAVPKENAFDSMGHCDRAGVIAPRHESPCLDVDQSY